jgi:hypothetical protein
MSEKIKDAVLAEAKSTQAIAQDVIMSGAYLYPFKVSSNAPQRGRFPTVSNWKQMALLRELSTSQPTKNSGVLSSLAPAEL